MRVSPNITAFAAVLLLAAVRAAHDAAAPSPTTAVCTAKRADGLQQYAGRFASGGTTATSVMVVAVRDGDLTMRPVLWSGLAHLERVGPDSFLAVHERRPGARFRRDDAGCVVGLDLLGLSPGGYHTKLREGETLPVEDLVNGRAREAARRFDRDTAGTTAAGTAAMVRLAQSVASMPTRARFAAEFLDELSRLRRMDAGAYAALGDILVAAHRRDAASDAYRHAVSMDSANGDARDGLVRLGLAAPVQTGREWTLPFSLSALFAAPTAGEIGAVIAEWRARDLSPRSVEVVARHQISLDGIAAEARVVTHDVLGLRHTGVIIVPAGARRGCCPILVEAKGVSPSFPPLNIPGSLTSPFVLGAHRGDVIYVVPGFRGEWVKVGADSLVSEGDRANAWDGAADGLIALLNVAKQITPEADTSRVCAFGRSRGGAVALLAGVREPSIDCVVSWAAPTEWLQLMGTQGWKQEELVAEGLRRRSEPGQVGGQFINYFLKPAIAGGEDLAATRRRIIASSVVHVVQRIPLTQAHWAEDDGSVPVINGRAFVDQFRAKRGSSACLDARFHAEAGHDQDRQRAPKQSREFLLRVFARSDSAVAVCRARALK